MREGILMLDTQLVRVGLPIRVCSCFSLSFSCVDGILVKHLNEQIFGTKLRCGRTTPWRAPRVEIKCSGNRNAKQRRLWLFLKIFTISSEACLHIFIERRPLEQLAWKSSFLAACRFAADVNVKIFSGCLGPRLDVLFVVLRRKDNCERLEEKADLSHGSTHTHTHTHAHKGPKLN